MGRTFIRQDTQVRNSDVYDDTIAPSLAAFETNPTEIEGDLNNVRSMLSHLLDVQAGNWYDVITTPSTLEAGSQRGVSNLNDALHLLEKKRVLRAVKLLTDVTVTASVAASETLTSSGVFTDTETVTIGSRTYTFRTPFVDAADNIDASGTIAQTHENLRRAINGDGVAGTNYGTGTAVHADVSAADTATTNVLTALAGGTQGNALVSTETGANLAFGGATFSGGAGGDVEVLGAGELPTNTTAAVGVVTTLGTVVASATAFLTAGLDEIVGSNAMSPKNLLELVDGSTGDPILTAGTGQSPAGKRIWGLLQGESGLTDGVTITDTTTTRVQISFVIGNATNDDLILVDGVEMGGKVINYCYRERIRLEDLVEGDFLNTASIDIGAGAVTPTRQLGYDNQGVTPVELATNADLDLSAGVAWTIRDLLDADLFQIIEGSGGGTTQLNILSDVDELDIDAVLTDFANGVTIDSGSASPIDVGVTDGHVETSAGDLHLQAAAEIFLDDVNQVGSTWAQTDGILLSDTTAEWDAYEVEFGEVSLLNAIVQAANPGNARVIKTYANVTATETADTDIGGTAGGANLDAQLPDMSAGVFLQDYDTFVNGNLQRPGADASANNDYYPGTSLALGQLKFEFPVKINDVIAVIAYT